MLKKVASIFLALAIISCFAASVFAEDKTNNKSSPTSMLVLGDSISTGYGLQNYNLDMTKTTSYANLLAQKYSVKNTYFNMAFDGQTSEQLASNLNRKLYDDYIKKSDVILISIGGNDVMDILSKAVIEALGMSKNSTVMDIKNIDFTNTQVYKNLINYITSNKLNILRKQIVSEFQKNFLTIYQYIHKLNPNAYLIFQTVYNPFSGVKNIEIVNNLAELIIPRVNKIITSNSTVRIDGKTEKMYDYIDTYSAFYSKASQYTNILNLDIHPNADGHKVIFEMCDKLISKHYNIATDVILNQPQASIKNSASSSNNLTGNAIMSSTNVGNSIQRTFIIMISTGVFGITLLAVYMYKKKNKKK